MSTEIILVDDIKSKIFTIRGLQVMLDRDLAKFYQIETRVLKQAVKRNINRFPDDFMLILDDSEIDFLGLYQKCSSLNLYSSDISYY